MPTSLLNTTKGATDATSYVDVEWANTYFASHWNQASSDLWSTKSSQQKERALLSAMSVIESLRVLDYEYAAGKLPLALIAEHYDLTVHRAEVGQRLQFPRNVDIDYTTGDTFIRQEVMEAQCEQAVYLMTMDPAALVAQAQGIDNELVSVGPIRTHTQYTGRGGMIAPMANQLMMEFIRPTARRFRRA